jgi:diguanylate cyclase (GGDEF)-like protein
VGACAAGADHGDDCSSHRDRLHVLWQAHDCDLACALWPGGEFNARIEENVGGIRVVQAFTNEDHERALFAQNNGNYLETKLQAYKVMAASMSLSYLSMRFVQVMVMLAGAWFVVRGDHFKAVNDNYGHAAGDEVLMSFAQRVRNCLRPGDAFGRVGGEEFAVVIPHCPKPDAIRVSERIREALAGTPIGLSDGRLVKVTASIGLSLSPETGAISVERLLSSADAALYRAKANGRDRVEISEFPGPVAS